MKQKKYRILAIALAAVVIAAIAGIAAVAQTATAQTTYLDFENGVNPFVSVDMNSGVLKNIDSSTVVVEASGNTVISLANSQVSSAMKGNAPYSTEYFAYGAGLDSSAWVEGARPTRAQFRFKAGNLNEKAQQNAMISFHPLQTNGHGYFGCKIGIQVNAMGENGVISFNNNKGNYQQFLYEGEAPAAGSGSLAFNKLTSPEDSPWYEFECVYDWSSYNAASGWAVGLQYSISDGKQTVTLEQKVKYQAPLNVAYTTKSDPAIAADTTYTVGFQGLNDRNFFAYVDDVRIWSEDAKDPQVKYAPAPQVTALGALAVENEETGKLNVRASFDFRTAVSIAKANGETVTAFGSLTVAGTKNDRDMQQALTDALNGTVPEGYRFLKNAVVREADIPDVYTVTVTNSGDAENIGKRMSSVAYIVTDKGTYMSRNDNTAMGVAYGVVNKSVMGLMKEIFLDQYLTAEYSNGLNEAIVDYNAAKGTSYTALDVKKIAEKTGVSTKTEKEFLSAIFEAMKTANPGGSEVFPGNW